MLTRPVLSGMAGFLIALGIITAADAAGPPAPPAANAATGQALFQQYCAACHGPEAKGGMKLGDATAADLRWQALSGPYHNDPALVQRAVLQGLDQDGKALDDVMPRWQGKLTTPQVQDLVAYLQTLTVAVPGQIVATPVHEEATPVPTEEAQEAAQAAAVLAQARTTTVGVSTAATSTAPAGVTATSGSPVGAWILAGIGLIGLLASATFTMLRRRT